MINIAGASEGRIALVITELLNDKKGQCLIVVPTLNRARRLQTDLSFFSARAKAESGEEEERRILILPPEDEGVAAYEAKSNDTLLERMRVLKTVAKDDPCIVIAPVTAAIRRLPPKETFRENILELKQGQDIDVSAVQKRLNRLGYERVPMIEACGEYSIRGGIIDIFTPEGKHPFRIELFDTEIDSIRTFDVETQIS